MIRSHKISFAIIVPLISMMLLSSMIVVVLSNNVFAQTLHDRTVHELVKQTSGLDEISGISVGDEPKDMVFSGRFNEEIDSEGGILYVTNYDSKTVSLISVVNNTVIEEIPVEAEAEAIVVDATADPVTGGEIERVYVTHDLSASVSVISIYENNSKTVENIPVDVRAGVGLADYQDPITTGGFITDPVTDREMGIVYVIGNEGISLISVENNTVIGGISFEEYPEEYLIPEVLVPSLLKEKVYVGTNSSNSILAISISLNNTEVNTTAIEEIDVGHGTTAIAVDSTIDPVTNESIERVYAVGSDSVSVISIYKNNSKTVENIPVQDEPTSIAVGSTSDPVTGGEIERVYVTHDLSASVSVISIYENNSKTVENIPVQDEPTSIVKHGSVDTVYVANTGSDSVSVIDESAKKVVAGVTFKVDPFNSGSILCDGLTTPSPTEQYIYVYSGVECIAKPNEGFEFVSWEENLEGNST